MPPGAFYDSARYSATKYNTEQNIVTKYQTSLEQNIHKTKTDSVTGTSSTSPNWSCVSSPLAPHPSLSLLKTSCPQSSADRSESSLPRPLLQNPLFSKEAFSNGQTISKYSRHSSDSRQTQVKLSPLISKNGLSFRQSSKAQQLMPVNRLNDICSQQQDRDTGPLKSILKPSSRNFLNKKRRKTIKRAVTFCISRSSNYNANSESDSDGGSDTSTLSSSQSQQNLQKVKSSPCWTLSDNIPSSGDRGFPQWRRSTQLVIAERQPPGRRSRNREKVYRKREPQSGNKPKKSRSLGKGLLRASREDTELEDSMAVKTKPGPLSLGLYIILLTVSLSLFGLFLFSEWRLVYHKSSILNLENDHIPVSCEAVDANNGKLVHIDCPIKKLHTFYPPSEFSWNVAPFTGLFLEMKVEMYQWVLHTKAIGFYFGGEWSTNLVDSSAFPFVFYNSHINPDFFPHIDGAGRRFASQIYGGSFRLAKKHLIDFHQKKQLPVSNDGYYAPPQERPPTHVNHANTQVVDNALYTGDPKKPKVGDLKITFWGSTATHVSAVAQQRKASDGTYELTSYVNRTGDFQSQSVVTELVYEGDHSPQEIFDVYLRSTGGSLWVIWTIRIVAVLTIAVLAAFSYRIFDTSTRVAVAPLGLGSLFISVGLLLAFTTPMWLLYSLLITVISGVACFLCFVAGSVIWYMGKQYVSTHPSLLEDQHADGSQPLSRRRPLEANRHFYQPV